MKEALKQLPVVPFEIPDGVTFVKVDAATGLLESEQEGEGQKERLNSLRRGVSRPRRRSVARIQRISISSIRFPKGNQRGTGICNRQRLCL